MPRKPDVACAGGCGTLLWRGAGSLPPGQAKCRDCRSAEPRKSGKAGRAASCAKCETSFTSVRRSNGDWTKWCSRSCVVDSRPAQGRDAARRRASWRTKNHRRRAACSVEFDAVTAELECFLRKKARICPLCACGMTEVPYLPHSKELDHIVPLNVGGTHTTGNVRIICRSCNLGRPKDGSDYAGQISLFALEVA